MTSSATGAVAESPHVAPVAAPSVTGRAGSRVAWLDLARVAAVVLVVLFHVSIGHYYGLEHADRLLVPWWDRVNQILTVVRMPLLFAISGLLAAGKIRRGFRGGRAAESAVTNYYLYAVWLGVYGLLILISGSTPVPFQVETAGQWLRQLYAPNTPLWYLFALSVYLLAFTALRRVPAVLVLSALFVFHLASTQMYTLESPLWTRALTFAFYFGLGVYGGEVVRFVARTPIVVAACAGGAYLLYQRIGMTKLMSLQPPAVTDAAVTVALYLLAGLAAVGVTALVCRAAPYRWLAEVLGRRTLGIYVLHIPLITVLDLAGRGPLAPVTALVGADRVVDRFYPLLATAVVVLACIAIEMAARRTGFEMLFSLPGPARARIEDIRAHLQARGAAPRPAARRFRANGRGFRANGRACRSRPARAA